MYSHMREADRRGALRFEVIGHMRASATLDVPVTVRNVGQGGALVEAPWPLPEKSVHSVRVQQGATFATLDARVCHVRRVAGASTYLIGLEFLGDAATLDTCAGLLSANESLA
jgi:hypothetical protein